MLSAGQLSLHQGIRPNIVLRCTPRQCRPLTSFGKDTHIQRNRCTVVKAGPSDEEQAQLQAAMQEAMKDPAVRDRMAAAQAQMDAAMKDPAAKQQMEQVAAVMQNQEMQKRVAALKDDPDLAPMFEEIQKGGMAAMMKFWNDPATLAKLGEKLGDVSSILQQSPAQAAPGAEVGGSKSAPDINSLVDAAKYGDLEAVEDFLAIGRDVNACDDKKRSPLHYSVAYWKPGVADALLEAGADVEAQDDMLNTPLHYATGYGRSEAVMRLLEAGADAGAENKDGRTPLDLITMEPRNPLNQNSDVLAILENASAAAEALKAD